MTAEYDNDGNLIEYETVETTEETEYDEYGNVVEYETVETVNETEIGQYDEYGNIIETGTFFCFKILRSQLNTQSGLQGTV